MTNLLYPATGKYLLNPAPEHLHDEVVQWLSDLEFYHTELVFLGKLIDKAFLKIISGPQLKELKALEEKLKSVRHEAADKLHTGFIQHEHALSSLDADVFKKKKTSVEKEHKLQFGQLNAFVSKTRELKKEVFTFVEKQLRLSKEVNKEYESGSLVL